MKNYNETARSTLSPREETINNLVKAWTEIKKKEHDTGLDYTTEKGSLLLRARELGIDLDRLH